MSASAVQPNPGSPEAIAKGCKCPVIDNHHGCGRGSYRGETVFIYNCECPVHCSPAALEEQRK